MDQIAETLRDAWDSVEFAGQEINVQVEPRLVVNPSPPTVDIYPADPPRDETLAGFGEIGAVALTVRARVSTADNVAGQELLIAFMDDNDELNVAGALWAGRLLDGWGEIKDISPPTGYGVYTDPSGQGAYLGVQWRVTVEPAIS